MTGTDPTQTHRPAPRKRASSKPRGRPRARSPRPAADPQVGGPVEAESRQDIVLTTPHDTAALTARLIRLASRLHPRDLAVLHALGALRLMSSDHVRRLVFAHGPTHTRALRARRALLRLHTAGLVVRVDRHVGGRGAGSTSTVYHLADQGQRLLGVRRSEPHALHGARAHTLAITDLAVALHEAHYTRALELVRFEPEPVSWRSYTTDGHRHYIRPDAFLIVAAGAWERLWWVELDRGTQSPAVIRRKAHAYAAYAETGIEQERHGVFPRVTYLTTTPDRCSALARALADTPHADQLATVARLDDATHTLAHATPPTTHPETENRP